MNSDEHSHIFIVRIWWETREIEDQPELWRGKVEYINRRKQKFFSNLDDLKAFIDAHIDGDGSKHGLTTPDTLGLKVRRWFKGLSETK